MLDKQVKILSCAPNDMTFKTGFGEISSLSGLKQALTEKGQNFFDEYVYGETNHFASWIQHVFEDTNFADLFRNAKTSDEAARLIDDRLRFAQLYKMFKEKNDVLSEYLTNGELSLKQVMNSPEFLPEHHKFETSLDIDMHSITKSAPPKTTYLLGFSNPAPVENKSDAVPQESVMQNAVVLQNTEAVRLKENVEREKEEQAAGLIQTLFPGFQVTNATDSSGEKKTLLQKIFSKVWK